jgi:hypothetical protein
MKTSLTALLFLAFTLAGHAQQPAPFEQPSLIPANRIVPGSVLRGDLHTVRPSGACDGLEVTYWIDAKDGTTYEAIGNAQLYQRIAEIYAIDALRRMDSGDQFANSLGNGAKNTVTAVGQTITDPVGTISSVPKGVSKFFGSLGESLKGGSSEYEDSAYTNVLGASKAKRSLASQLGVNPYSTNKVLMDELNRVAWSEAGGTLTVHLAVAAIPAGASTALNMNRTAQAEIVENDPKQLAIINRKKLMAIGLSQRTADILIKAKAFSPLHKTAITEALISLGAGHGQDAFIQATARATTEIDANYFQQVAQLIEKYNQSECRVQTIVSTGRSVSFHDTNGAWVFPVPYDYCLWTSSVSSRANALFAQRQPGQRLIVYSTGIASPTARAACDNNHVKLIERVSLE